MIELIMQKMNLSELEAIQEFGYIRQLYKTGEFDVEELLERLNINPTEKRIEMFLKEIQ